MRRLTMMELYRRPEHAETRWASFENPTAGRGVAAHANHGAKGHAFEGIEPGATKVLFHVEGCGTIRRMWLTVSDRSPVGLRGLRLDIYWDGANRPAASVPLGDFFGLAHGRALPFECALFASPEAKSWISYIPMPFRTTAKVTLTNETGKPLTHLFYDVDAIRQSSHPDDALYFHAHWRRESPNVLGHDYLILPRVDGWGRYLGCNIGVITNALYGDAWWGEGEVKVWFGDDAHPTLCGTGTEDYIGTAWGVGLYAQRQHGCLLANDQKKYWAFYRYHVDDPVYFDEGCRVAIQTIGGTSRKDAAALQKQGVPLIPVSMDWGGGGKFMGFYEPHKTKDLSDPTLPDGWVNFYRQDDWCSTAYFYLDRPESNLSGAAPLEGRLTDLAAATAAAPAVPAAPVARGGVPEPGTLPSAVS